MSFFSNASDTDFEKVSAEVSFILDLQLAIENAMDERGLTQADLARLLDISEARVSQMLSDSGANLRARTIGRLGDAFNATPCLRFEPRESTACAVSIRSRKQNGRADWGRAVAANENRWHQETPLLVAAG